MIDGTSARELRTCFAWLSFRHRPSPSAFRQHHQLQLAETLNSINSLHLHETANYLIALAYTRLCLRTSPWPTRWKASRSPLLLLTTLPPPSSFHNVPLPIRTANHHPNMRSQPSSPTSLSSTKPLLVSMDASPSVYSAQYRACARALTSMMPCRLPLLRSTPHTMTRPISTSWSLLSRRSPPLPPTATLTRTSMSFRNPSSTWLS